MSGIIGIGHLALRVRDLDRSLDFWRDRVGFQEMDRLRRDDGTTWLVYLRITDTQCLELFPDATTDKVPPDDQNGVMHICLEIDDLDVEIARLEQAGVKIVAPIKSGQDNNRGAWVFYQEK